MRSGFDGIQEQYFAILGKSAELDAQRTAARENRSGIVGGGFGVEGAAKGIAMATAANAAIGLAYGLVNLTAKAVSELGDEKKKRELMDAPATKTTLANFLCEAVLQGYRQVADAVNTASAHTFYEVVTDEEQKRSSAMVHNVSSGRVPTGEVKVVLAQSLELNPFNEKAWILWLDHYGDEDGSVEATAKSLSVKTVEAYKVQLIDSKRKAMAWTNSDQCRSNGLLLEHFAKSLGVDFVSELARIEKLADDFYRKSCSHAGKVYPTPEAAKAAADADKAAADADRVRQDEIQSRTFDGVLYQTVAEVSKARADKRENELLLSSSDSGWGWATLAFRRKLSTDGRSCRREFWSLLLLYLFVSGLISTLSGSLTNGGSYEKFADIILSFLFLIFSIYVVAIALTVQIRRFHDFDKTGFLVLINLVPYVGWLLALALMLVPSTQGDNRYGPDPSCR